MTHPAQRDAFETPHPQRQRATRFDVARPAGVSTAVVSYVLNDSPKKISPDTAQRVFDAAQRLDYHPNSVARALKTGTTHTLGVIVPDFSNPYFAEFTDQLEAAASKRERALIINLPRGDPQGERRRINELVERNIDAMFVSSAQTDAELGALRGQRGARPRAHARRAAHRRRTRHQAVLRMQVTGRQVAANGSQ
ncbi:LacI family DNA-binding transcriptional regulator [Bifidobacterium bifidum]|uniref:LacI family DNA-binding transcriptional regulator n=1 Tax=Bifidobacterium bifidum TaxID=1681 RepID=UPI0023305DA5|nr:LacI family DNA-binding transcriptional regulator [Bifidobacterium bifidum]MDB1267694.1 LacI family DNA-binding transcriptional regulator [Bifidobacterium bifidum]